VSEATVKLKRLHAGQVDVLSNAKRFNVLKIGRRWGKTTLAVNELLIQPAIDGFPVAYFSPTHNDMSDVWNETKDILRSVIKSKNEQLHQMRLVTGGVIDFWSMDNPDSGRGRKYKRVVVDEAEKARKFKEAWQGTILPTLMDYKGDAWILSTPKFGQTYFKQIHSNYLENDSWASFNLSTYSNPFIDHSEIEEIKKTMDDLSFRCEILAEDVDVSNNPFAYAFDEKKHVVDPIEFDPKQVLYLSFDFNKDPITAIACQHVGFNISVIKEFSLKNSDIYELCDQIIAAYPNASMLITGDATGRNRTAMTKGNMNYYTVIKQKLRLIDTQLKVGSVNPSVADTRVLVNSMLQNATVKVSRSCPILIRDLKYVEVDENGDIKKDRSNVNKEADQLDCLRYYLFTFHRNFLKM
jgi:hypothetical protein